MVSPILYLSILSNNNFKRCLTAILSGSVPMDISHSVTPTPIEHPVKLAEDAKLPLASSWPPTPVQSSLPRYSEKAVAHTAPGTVIEKIYYGKREYVWQMI
jgi:hypothetical protein